MLNKCASLMPNERFIYLADSAYMPYGTKHSEVIKRAAYRCADMLFAMNCKAILVACNTATENAIDGIRTLYPDKIVVGLEPAIRPALRDLQSGYIVALVTPATYSSQKFGNIVQSAPDRIVALPSERLASLVECGDDDNIEREVVSLLSPHSGAGAIVLGCSHYSYIRPIIESRFGGMAIYDGGDGAAARLLYRLKENGLTAAHGARGKIDFYSTVKCI